MSAQRDGSGAPPLWNPRAAGGWSRLFGPCFGAAPHWQNWRMPGQAGRVAGARRWRWRWCWSLILMALLLSGLGGAGLLPPGSHGVDLALVAGWHVASGCGQCRHVAATLGDADPRRPLVWPVALASACSVLVMGLLILLAYIAPQGPELA